MMGRNIVVEVPKNKTFIRDKPPKFHAKFNSETNTAESKNIIVRNLPFDFSEDQLRSTFE